MLTYFFVSFCLNLSDTLSGNAKNLSHFFQGVSKTINQSVTHLKNFSFFYWKIVQYFSHLVCNYSLRRFFVWSQNFVICKKVSKLTLTIVTFISHWALK